jgi:hypothetical protein
MSREVRIAFYCVRPMPHGFCGHVGRINIETALERWGDDKQLGEIPARCGRCGSGEFVSVRGGPPGRLGKRGRR